MWRYEACLGQHLQWIVRRCTSSWRKVKDIAPLVCPQRQTNTFHLFEHFLVVVILHRHELDVGWWLDDRVCTTVKHDLKVVTVTQSQLGTTQYQLAVSAVTDECGAVAGSHRNHWVFTKVHCRLGMTVMDVDIAIVTRLYPEHLVQEWPWFFEKKLGLLGYELEISNV
jgi:hypothetical protein